MKYRRKYLNSNAKLLFEDIAEQASASIEDDQMFDANDGTWNIATWDKCKGTKFG